MVWPLRQDARYPALQAGPRWLSSLSLLSLRLLQFQFRFSLSQFLSAVRRSVASQAFLCKATWSTISRIAEVTCAAYPEAPVSKTTEGPSDPLANKSIIRP